MPTTSNIQPSTLTLRVKWSTAALFAFCCFLLCITFYGLWQWVGLLDPRKAWALQQVFYLISLVIVPLTLLLFMVALTARHREHVRLSTSYQVRLDQVQQRLHYQEDLLGLMTDHHPGAITIFDEHNRYWFVNRSAAKSLGFDATDIIGKPAIKIIGHERTKRLEARLSAVRTSGKAIEAIDPIVDDQGQTRFIQSQYEILPPFSEIKEGVIVREDDLTALIVERERRENMLRQVIGTLVAVVDRRDPYAAGHSARVGQLARAIAEEMVLDEQQIEAAEIAGSLMNFGKVLVPREILTKTTALTPEELQRVRESILTSADILSIIGFAGPVVPTLRQVMERYDGTGAPEGLKGDDIMVTARIVTVANTYVALVSPRAHRPSLALKKAAEIMMQDAGKIYDRRVVLALANYIENRPNKLDWLYQKPTVGGKKIEIP